MQSPVGGDTHTLYHILDRSQMNEAIHTNCCIVGGGPAGMMLGFLLAWACEPALL